MTDSSNRFVEHIMGYLRVYKQSVISSLLKSLIVALALFLPTAYFRLIGADSLSLALRGASDAFAVSGAFTFGSHLAFTMAFDGNYILPMIVGKLISGICAVVLACLIYKAPAKEETS